MHSAIGAYVDANYIAFIIDTVGDGESRTRGPGMSVNLPLAYKNPSGAPPLFGGW